VSGFSSFILFSALYSTFFNRFTTKISHRIADEEQMEDVESSSRSFSYANPLYESVEDKKINIKKKEAEKVDDSYGLWVGSNRSETVSGLTLLFQQYKTLTYKRVINTIRNKILIVSQLIVPLCFLIIFLLVSKYAINKTDGDLPSLEMTLSVYGPNFLPFIALTKNQEPLALLLDSFARKSSTRANPVNLRNETVDSLCYSSRSEVEPYLVCLTSFSHLYLLDKSIVGASFDDSSEKMKLTGHFNDQYYHSPSLTLTLFTNILLQYFSNNSNLSIRTFNHPLPKNTDDIVKGLLTDTTSFNIATNLTFGFAFLLSSFAVFLIKERVSGAKHLQYMNGSNCYIFWTSSIIWDMLNYFIPCVLVIIILKVFEFSLACKTCLIVIIRI
jgi:ATP-binding cassette subfamily A (ABC1) protein 3